MLLFTILSAALITGYVSAKRLRKIDVLAICFYDQRVLQNYNRYDARFYYAELSKNPAQKDFRALNGLPNGHPLRISYNNGYLQTITAYKDNFGAVNYTDYAYHKPQIAIHETVAYRFGFTCCQKFGARYVSIESAY